MSLYHVHMHLARSPEFPQGSRSRGYEMVMPLNAAMQFDPTEWKSHVEDCKVRRFWEGEEAKLGRLRHYSHGWVIDYDLKVDGDEEPLFKLKDHRIAVGEYLSIREADGESHTFLIESVVPFAAPKSKLA